MTVQTKPTRTYPSSIRQSVRPCPLCGTTNSSLAVVEEGIEYRFDMPVLPVSDYGQVHCAECGLLYINGEISDDYLVELYSQENVEWQHEYVGDENAWNGGTPDEELRRFSSVVELASRYKDLRGVSWLDFGCQTGEMGEIAQKRFGARMSGVDVSADYAARADKLWGGRNTVRTSLDAFLRAGPQFDVVSALETLEHIATPWETLKALRQTMKPDGLLIATVPSAQYFKLKYHVFKAIRSVRSPELVRERPSMRRPSIFGLCHTHPYNFSPASLRLLLARGGFETIHVGGMGWSRRFRLAEAAARAVSFGTAGSVQIFPSVVAVAQ